MYLSLALLTSNRYIIIIFLLLGMLENFWRVIDSYRYTFNGNYSNNGRLFDSACFIQHFNGNRLTYIDNNPFVNSYRYTFNGNYSITCRFFHSACLI